MVVEDVAVDGAEAGRPAAQAVGLRRRLVAHQPGPLVHAVDERLGNVVAREPIEVVPVAVLVLDLGLALLAIDEPVGRPHIRFLDGHDLANGPVQKPLHGLLHAGVIPPAKPGDDAEVFLFGLFAGGDDSVDSRRVDGVRLLNEDVFAGVDGCLEIDRMEAAGAGDQHHVHPALDDLLIAVEADEAVVVVDGHLIRLGLLEPVAASPDLVFKDVGHGDELRPGVGVHGVGGRAGAPAAAADQAELQRLIAGRMGRSAHGQAAGHGGGNRGRRGLQKIATRRSLPRPGSSWLRHGLSFQLGSNSVLSPRSLIARSLTGKSPGGPASTAVILSAAGAGRNGCADLWGRLPAIARCVRIVTERRRSPG